MRIQLLWNRKYTYMYILKTDPIVLGIIQLFLSLGIIE